MGHAHWVVAAKSIHLDNAVVMRQQVSFFWWWKEEDAGLSLRGQRCITLMARERDRRKHVRRHAAAQAVHNQPPVNNLDRLHLPPTPPTSSKHYPSTLIIFYCSEIQCEVLDFPQAAATFANVQSAS